MKKYIGRLKKIFHKRKNDKDQIKAMKFDANRLYDSGRISKEEFDSKINYANKLDAKLKSMRDEYWDMNR